MEENKNLTESVTDEKVACGVFDLVNNCISYGEKQIKIFIVEEEPWFKEKDVASILGYKNTSDALKDNIDVDDKSILKKLVNGGVAGNYPAENFTNNELNSYFINESGLYSLILSSKLKTAKQFKKYVTKEILPNIRKSRQVELTDSPYFFFHINNSFL